MSATDRLVANAADYARAYSGPQLPATPSLKVAIVACMDARLDPYRILGLHEGDAHVIRNAGGVISDDAIRSLVVSQRLLATEEVVILHHTDCGMRRVSDEELRQGLRDETGVEPDWPVHAFSDVEADVRRSIARVLASPFIPSKHSVRGFVFDVKTGELREVPA
jgi:carbonic anhydrase